MKCLEVSNNRNRTRILIDNVKYVFGKNYNQKYQLVKSISQYFNQIESEYRKEEAGESIVAIDNEPIHIKRTMFLRIHKDYSISDEEKLGTKSLMLKYVEAKLLNSDLLETINTIDLLFKSLTDEVSEDNEQIQTPFSTITNKVLTKMVKPCYVDDYQKDEYDLTIEEIITLQLKMLLKIQNENLYEDYLTIVEIPCITNKIREFVEKLKGQTLVFTNETLFMPKCEEALAIEDETIDFADENTLYSLFGETNGIVLPIKEVKDMCNNFINRSYVSEKTIIVDDVKNFFIHNK